MRNGMKILSFALIVMTIVSMTVVFATFDNAGIEVNAKAPGNSAETARNIIGAIQWIGYAIAVGMLIFIGIKYVMASADEKANLKNALIRYVIGAVLIAGATTIAGWIFKIV